MNTCETLMEERKYLESVIKSSTTFLKDAPDGSIEVKKKQEYVHLYYYSSIGSKYLSHKKSAKLIRVLAQKVYEKKVLKAAMKQKAVIEKFLACYNPNVLNDVLNEINPELTTFISKYENFCKPTPETTTITVEKTDSGVDFARNLIAICKAFLK